MPIPAIVGGTSTITLNASPTRFAGVHPIRALHVVNGEHYSGAERVQDLLAESLPEEGCEIGFATLKPGKFDETRRAQSTPLTPLVMKSRWSVSAARRLARLAVAERYDLLHAHTPRALLLSTIASGSTGLPLVYHVHSPVARDSTRWLQNRVNTLVECRCLRRVDRVIVVAPSLVDYMADLGVARNRIECVPNGVPTVEAVARRERAPDEPVTLGMVALFRPRKGTEVLLDALAAAVSAGHTLHLRLIGGFESTEYEQAIKQRISRLGIDSSITWVGFTTDIAGELARLDAMVLPSLFGEGLPMVVLEAMAAGVPVVATRVEGTALAIEHGRSGLLVEPGCTGSLTDAIEQIATGTIDLTKISEAARQRHAEKFSAQAMARGVAASYRSLLASRVAR